MAPDRMIRVERKERRHLGLILNKRQARDDGARHKRKSAIIPASSPPPYSPDSVAIPFPRAQTRAEVGTKLESVNRQSPFLGSQLKKTRGVPRTNTVQDLQPHVPECPPAAEHFHPVTNHVKITCFFQTFSPLSQPTQARRSPKISRY